MRHRGGIHRSKSPEAPPREEPIVVNVVNESTIEKIALTIEFGETVKVEPTPEPEKPKTIGDAAFWVGGFDKPKPKPRMRGMGADALAKAFAELEEMLKAGQIAKATGRHFVALYADLYCRVYEVPPEDLGSKERVYAAKLANDMLAKDFGGDAEKFADFVGWTWTREKGREDWRREYGRKGSRISWRVQFSQRSLFAEYQLDKHRERTSKK